MKFTPENIQKLEENQIFVYGANCAGRHGAGAARLAFDKFGAKWGKYGFAGQTYGIPTKDFYIQTLSIPEIKKYVDQFIEFAIKNPDLEFLVTKIGMGLAGLNLVDIAPLFRRVVADKIDNVVLPEEFVLFLTKF